MTAVTHTPSPSTAPTFDPAALDAAYAAVGCEIRVQEYRGRRALSFFTRNDAFPPEHRQYTADEKAALIAYVEAQGRVETLNLGPGVAVIPSRPPRIATEVEHQAIRKLVRLMCDMMRGNKGKTFYVTTETSVITFEIPAHLYERERQAYYRISAAYAQHQNIVGFGLVKKYM
jgi:hypothetical protein